MIEELLSKPRVIKSYYYSVNLAIVMNSASYLYHKGKDVCIFNFDKIKWEFYPYEIDFKMNCNENSENIIFEAEDESEVPVRFALVTSIKRLNLGVPISEITKIDNNLYRINIDGKVHLFRLLNGKIIEENISRREEEIISLLKEYGELTIKEVVDIIARKTRSNRDEVRKDLYFLKEIGIVEINEGKVSLNNYSRLKR